jgi:hypothetical protein
MQLTRCSSLDVPGGLKPRRAIPAGTLPRRPIVGLGVCLNDMNDSACISVCQA